MNIYMQKYMCIRIYIYIYVYIYIYIYVCTYINIYVTDTDKDGAMTLNNLARSVMPFGGEFNLEFSLLSLVLYIVELV